MVTRGQEVFNSLLVLSSLAFIVVGVCTLDCERFAAGMFGLGIIAYVNA